jgi:hypothetical protein
VLRIKWSNDDVTEVAPDDDDPGEFAGSFGSSGQGADEAKRKTMRFTR